MPIKNKKNTPDEPMDLANFVVKVLQDSAITIFWETIDRFKKEVRVRMEIGIQSLLGMMAVLVGLIFMLIGIADFLEEFIGQRGIGYILTGILVTISGIWVAEKAKIRKESNTIHK